MKNELSSRIERGFAMKVGFRDSGPGFGEEDLSSGRPLRAAGEFSCRSGVYDEIFFQKD
jgi:hypothetical protein